jgi:AcrR family transcriptional regulator
MEGTGGRRDVGDTPGLRDLILRNAADLFATNGYQQTSTREIADICEIEIAMLFHHFASKAEIMNTILKHDLGAAVEAAERQLAGRGSPALRLYRYLVEDLSVALRSPYAVGINATSGLLKELDFAGARARSQRLGEARAALIRAGIDAGELVELDPGAASKAIEWTIEGSLTEAATRSMSNPDEVAHQIAGLCLRALLIDAGFLEDIRHDFPTAVDEYPAQ